MDRVLIALFIAVLVLVALGSENGALDEPFLMERLDGSSAPPLQGSTSYATSSYPSSKLDRTSRKLESGSPKDGSFNGGATARNTMVGQIETYVLLFSPFSSLAWHSYPTAPILTTFFNDFVWL